jgi:molybdate transport system substrate-binding protein
MKYQQYNNKPFKSIFFLIVLSITVHLPVLAQNVRVAAAANLQSVMDVLQQDFKQKTGITIESVIGSSGKLVAQISNGAPFDIFLSADMSFPDVLFKGGFATGTPVVYAKGSLIICSQQDIGFNNWERLLLTKRIKKIAIANPEIAPYGKAAMEVLAKKGIADNVKSKIVSGESISQVNTYITTGVADVGFTTQSLVKETQGKTQLYYKIINPKDYKPILQGMVKLKRAEANANSEKFYQYMLSAPAKTILAGYGYLVQ